MTWGSFGQQYLITGNTTAANILVSTSHALAQRFVPTVKAFESWGPLHPKNEQIEVIVDNMLNLQLMFFAGAYSNNETLTNMAISHAGESSSACESVACIPLSLVLANPLDTTLENWFQPWCNGCVWHLVVFNESSGEVLNRSSTPQGLSKDSVWSRGQAWAVNGFTLAFRYTRLERYLTTAQFAADAYLRLLVSNFSFYLIDCLLELCDHRYACV